MDRHLFEVVDDLQGVAPAPELGRHERVAQGDPLGINRGAGKQPERLLRKLPGSREALTIQGQQASRAAFWQQRQPCSPACGCFYILIDCLPPAAKVPPCKQHVNGVVKRWVTHMVEVSIYRSRRHPKIGLLRTLHIVFMIVPLGPVLVASAPRSTSAEPLLCTHRGKTPAALCSVTIFDRVKYSLPDGEAPSEWAPMRESDFCIPAIEALLLQSDMSVPSIWSCNMNATPHC